MTQSSLPPDCDQRLLKLHDYWRSIIPRGEQLPGRQHFDPLDIPTLLPWVWLVDAYRNPLRFKYRLMGTEHARLSGRDVTGRWMDEVHPDLAALDVYPQWVAVVERAEIGYRRGSPLFPTQDEYEGSERLLLPLARDGVEVDMVLAMTVHHPHLPGAIR
jgi:hypothetical protein